MKQAAKFNLVRLLHLVVPPEATGRGNISKGDQNGYQLLCVSSYLEAADELPYMQ